MSLPTPSNTNNTSQTVALASVLSFGAQVVFALLMLRWFTPQEVGAFSVVSQIAFFWMTLALAQAPLSLLVNQTHDASRDARKLWLSSVWRWCALAPLALLALWTSQLSMLPALGWVVVIALCQLSWGLAQSFVLRKGDARQQLYVRVVPPLCAVVVAGVGAQFAVQMQWLMQWLMPWPWQSQSQGTTLFLAALLGYFVGSLWLVPAWLNPTDTTPSEPASETTATSTSSTTAIEPHQSDNRTTPLRLTHTFFDVVLATAVVIVWQRLYGAQDTGWLSALLRVFGFVPAVIHMAWAQVKLSQPGPSQKQPMWVGGLGVVSLIAMALAGLLALHMQWLDPQWQGIAQYMWPLVLWQGSACLSAAVSHRPFQTGAARQYSLACIGIASLQLVLLLAPVVFQLNATPLQHFIGFALISSFSLLVLTRWMHNLSTPSSP